MEKPEGKHRHTGEPEASVPWEELRVTAFLFKDSTELFERSWGVWCGQQPVLGILGEPLQRTPAPPESQDYQPKGSLRSCPTVHPTLLLTTTAQQRKQGEAQPSVHSSL